MIVINHQTELISHSDYDPEGTIDFQLCPMDIRRIASTRRIIKLNSPLIEAIQINCLHAPILTVFDEIELSDSYFMVHPVMIYICVVSKYTGIIYRGSVDEQLLNLQLKLDL